MVFPRDHGKHGEFQTEWWYFTGNLRSDHDRDWGFQLTFFRRAIGAQPVRKGSEWAVRDVWPAHFALVDIKNGEFFHTELITREGPGLAEAASDGLKARVKNWKAEEQNGAIRLNAEHNGYALDLTLAPAKPVVLHGDAGYSRKGDSEQQASYYYSFTRLTTEGAITFNNTVYQVKGLSWMDHEFGSGILEDGQSGWDWFSLQLDDGADIMVFNMRKKDGSPEKPLGTVVGPDGIKTDLSAGRVLISSLGAWTSPRSGAVYPSGWRLEIPGEAIDLEIAPAVLDQELSAEKSTGVIYWEGAVTVKGARRGKPVQGRGYVELTGYANSMAGKL
jgi:predicted secreted hydrolase